MSRPTIQLTAAKKDRSLGEAAPAKRFALPPSALLFWRRLIDTAVADACCTFAGLPTDSAILARWWIEEHRPTELQRDDWQVSFECCCLWLNMNADVERRRLLLLIEKELQTKMDEFVRAWSYVRRAAVLTCAGMPTDIAGQFQLPLVSERDYEHVAGIEHGDPIGAQRVLAQRKAA